jgi:enoyl-CoA hydratase/carnithine racemase
MFDLSFEEGIATLRLDRLEARNAIPIEGWPRIAELAREAEQRARLLLVKGSRAAFCAGADIGEFPALQRDEGMRVRFREAMREAFDTIRTLAIPTIAIIDGPCFGAGVALALACDLRIAGPEAKFAITPAKMGISYPQEDVYALVSLVGRGNAARLLFGGLTIDCRESLRIGLADMPLDEAFERLLAAILANSAASIAALKRGIALAEGGQRSSAEQDESFDALLGGDELLTRLGALRPKR